MKYGKNIQNTAPDIDPRFLRDRVKNRNQAVLRDTNYLIGSLNEGFKPKRLTLGHTIIYSAGTTTGHSHDDMEEIYYATMGKRTMVVGEDEYEIEQGDILICTVRLFSCYQAIREPNPYYSLGNLQT